MTSLEVQTIGIAYFTTDKKLILIKKYSSYNFSDIFLFLEKLYELSFTYDTKCLLFNYMMLMTYNEVLHCINFKSLSSKNLWYKKNNKIEYLESIYNKLKVQDMAKYIILNELKKEGNKDERFYLPSGKPKKTETPIKTALREFVEETRILDCKQENILNLGTPFQFISINPTNENITYKHTCFIANGNIHSNDICKYKVKIWENKKTNREIVGIKAVSYDELIESNFQFKKEYEEIFNHYNNILNPSSFMGPTCEKYIPPHKNLKYCKGNIFKFYKNKPYKFF